MTGRDADRLRRLGIRSWGRGTREMDLILGRFADAELAGLDAASLEAFEALLSENDHDLYAWIAGSGSTPARFQEIVERIRAHHCIG